MSRYLLDTNAWLWSTSDPDRLGKAMDLVRDGRNQLVLSAASTWEISIKYGIGRLDLPEPPRTYVPSRIQATDVTPLPIEHSHAAAVAELPPHHADPFDRLLIAQAQVLNIPIITADRQFEPYDVELVLF